MSCDTVEDDVECVHAEVIMLNADEATEGVSATQWPCLEMQK